MKTPRFIAQQLSRPQGLLGRLIARMMNQRNAKMNVFAVQQLQIEPSDRVLEIGIGRGVTLPMLLERASFVCGVDRSCNVIHNATEHYSDAVNAGRALFRQGTVELLPCRAASFEKVCTVNTVYFWTSLEQGFAEIRRVLLPGGRVVVGFLPKERMDGMGLPADIFHTRTSESVVSAMMQAGFTEVCVERPMPDTAWNVIAGVVPRT